MLVHQNKTIGIGVVDLTEVNEKIDSKADKTDLAEVNKRIDNFSNPNLLDNPWFTVNQRGKSEYSNNANQYCVDRWYFVNRNNYSVNVYDDGVIIDATNCDANIDIRQKLELFAKDIVGKTISSSIKFADGTVIKGTAKITQERINSSTQNIFTVNHPTIDPATGRNIIFMRLALEGTEENSRAYVIIQIPKGTISPKIRAVKLEFGVCTIENDIAPDYATELLKCQRYFYSFNPLKRTDTNGIGSGNASETSVYTLVHFPCCMKEIDISKCKIAGSIRAIGNGTVVNNTSPTINAIQQTGVNCAKLTLGGFVGLTANQVYAVEPYGSEPIVLEISADL